MKYLNKKFIRDIMQQWKQFVSVLIMALISVSIYCGMSSVWTGMDESYTDYKEKTNLADAYIDGVNISDEDISNIKKLPYVNQAEGSMFVKFNTKIDNEDSELYINSFTSSTKKLMNPLLRSGHPLKDDEEGIWIDEDYAKIHNLKEGDKIVLEFKGIKKKVKILGTVLDAENIYFITSYAETVPDHKRHGYAYISEKYINKILGIVSYNQVRLDLLEKPVSKSKLEKDIKRIMGDSFSSVVMKENKISITQVDEEINQVHKMAMLFSIVFILLSILSIYTTMSRLISNQMVQIGTLKSLGFYDRQIYFHYGAYGFLVAIIGSLVGVIFGYTVVANLVMNIKKATLTLPVWKKSFGIDSMILIVLILTVCTLAAIITTRKVVKNNPSFTIKGMLDKKSSGPGIYKKSRLSYDWLWTLRSIRIHPIRTFMSITAIVGSIVLMVAGLGVWDSLYSSYQDVYNNEFCYKYVGQVYGESYNNLSRKFNSFDVQFAQSEMADFSFHGIEKSGSLLVLDSGDKIRIFDAKSKKKIRIEKDEVAIASQLAEQLDVKVGDKIAYKTNSSLNEYRVTITAIVDAKIPQGIFIYKDKVKNFEPNTIYIGDSEAYEQAKKEESISNIISIKKQQDNMKEMMDSVRSIMYILIVAAFVLSVVILYNLGILSYLERYREYATMKVIGFKHSEIMGMVFKESVLNLLTGFVIGIPLSKQFLKLYIRVVSMDSMEWTPIITKDHFLIVIFCVIGFSVLVNLVVSMRIRKIDMVEALKSIE